MRIRFLSDQTYERTPGKGPFFPAGYVLDAADVAKVLDDKTVTDEWAEGFLRRWTQRSVAEEVDGRAQTTIEAEKAAPGSPLKPEKAKPKAKPAPKTAKPTETKDAALGTAKRGRATKGLDDGKSVEKTDLTRLSRDELNALAEKRVVDISDATTDADVIAALELAEELGAAK